MIDDDMGIEEFPPQLDEPDEAREALADVPREEGEPSELPPGAPLRMPAGNPDVETEL